MSDTEKAGNSLPNASGSYPEAIINAIAHLEIAARLLPDYDIPDFLDERERKVAYNLLEESASNIWETYSELCDFFCKIFVRINPQLFQNGKI